MISIKFIPIQICHAIKMKMTFQSRVHTSMAHPAVDMSITLLPHLFSVKLMVLLLREILLVLKLLLSEGWRLSLEVMLLLQLIVVVKVAVVFGVAVVVQTIVVVAVDVDVKAFAGNGVAVVVEDDVEWNRFLHGEGGDAVILWTAIRFVFLFLQNK